MVKMTPPRQTTPVHHPIYGVALPETYIERLVGVIFPGCHIGLIEQLPSGQSFNNRIYFVDVLNAQQGNQCQRLVLKANGRFFGSGKVQNEVSCLRIIERYCPELPVPRVVAWSEDGRLVKVPPAAAPASSNENVAKLTGDEASQDPGWILMTRIEGEAVSTAAMDETAMISVGQQLADMVASWRLNVPRTRHCGNMLFWSETTPATPAEVDINLSPDGLCSGNAFDTLVVRGIIEDGIASPGPLSSLLRFHGVRIEAKLRDLEREAVYAPNRDLIPIISSFISKTLPTLFPDKGNTAAFVFTHRDLSPRNIIVAIPKAGGRRDGCEGPRISGIIDFEFGGFLAPESEFVNDYINDGGDWPKAVYSAYLARLEERGVPTPLRSMDRTSWNREHRLEKLIDNIAPWWLPGDFDEETLAGKLAECRRIVTDIIEGFSL